MGIESGYKLYVSPQRTGKRGLGLDSANGPENRTKIKSIAIAAMDENDELAGAMDLLQELMLKPNGEAQEIVKTYNVAFTSAEGSDYGRNDNITFSDGNYTLALDIYGEDYKYTKSGTYVVGAEDGYYIDTNINYTYFMKEKKDRYPIWCNEIEC